MADTYDPAGVEAKWQKIWDERQSFRAADDAAKKRYILVEFPYPSGEGLHVGHARSYSALDCLARQRRLLGENVLYPMGFDAFGLPTENYAIKTGVHPRVATDKNIAKYTRQLKLLGLSFDWSRTIDTSDPKYYRWTQWIFLQLLKAGLAYQAEMPINWCPKDKIGLANEEVIGGKCERCGTAVTRKRQKQWMLKITAYAERLLKDLDRVDYLPDIKQQQVHWIGRSEGAEVTFRLPVAKRYVLLHGFTATPDANFHPWLKQQLEALGAEVIVPALPNTEHPTEEGQVGYVLEHVPFDQETVLLGHSLGAVVALKVVEKLKHPIAGLALVAGFTEPDFIEHPRPFAETFHWTFDWAKIRKNVVAITVLRAHQDTAVPAAAVQKLADALRAQVSDAISQDDHFCAAEEPAIREALVPGIKVFTTRPDTLFGATYLVLSPEHSLVERVVSSEHRVAVDKYVKQAAAKSDLERADLAKEKTGVFTGAYAINPANKEKIPIWVADYVLSTYGSGAIMAVPAHDERDYEFAKKYKLQIRPVIIPSQQTRVIEETGKKVVTQTFVITSITDAGGEQINRRYVESQLPYEGYGYLIDSGDYTDSFSTDAIPKMAKAFGKLAVQYKLRDWVFSRQHYWGEPIPVVHCPKDGVVPVPEDQLPVELPHVEKYQPTDTGESPLATIKDWVNTTCPNCGGKAKRETDTMPNWAGSSWYFLRYIDPRNDRALADPKKLKYWLPVDIYNGGREHTTLHLLYSRFWYKFLFDQGVVPTPEPYAHRHSHGLVLAEDGRKMSKSRGDVVNPDDVIREHGADSLRLFEMFMGPFEDAIPWSTKGLIGMRRFLERVWRLAERPAADTASVELTRHLHRTIQKVSADLEAFKFNTAVAALMILVKTFGESKTLHQPSFITFLTLLLPFAPHASSELLERFGQDPLAARWPVADRRLSAEERVTIVIQVAGKRRDAIRVPKGSDETTVRTAALALASVKRHVSAAPARVVFVPDRLINFLS